MPRVTLDRINKIIKSEYYSFIRQTNRRFLVACHPVLFIKTIFGIKLVVAPTESWFFFLRQLRHWQRLMRHRKYYRKIEADQCKIFGQHYFDSARRSGRPVVGVFWHHGARGLEELLLRQIPAISLSSYDERHKNTIETSNKRALISLIHARNILMEKKMPLGVAFDGPDGKRDIPVVIFGQPSYVAHGYPALVKMLRPIVIPFTRYATEDFGVELYFHPPLFDDEELAEFSEQQLVGKTVDFFTKDLLKHGRYQVAYYKLFRFRIDDKKNLRRYDLGR